MKGTPVNPLPVVTMAQLTIAQRSPLDLAMGAGGAAMVHRYTMRALPDGLDDAGREQARLLWRADVVGEQHRLTIQTTHPEADFSVFEHDEGLEQLRVLHDVLPRLGRRLETGATTGFMARVNPTRCLPGTNRRRVGITNPDEVAEWFVRQGRGAFELATNPYTDAPDIAVDTSVLGVPRPDGTEATFAMATVWGSLRVLDREAMADMLCRGVGRGKAFGLGLVQVR